MTAATWAAAAADDAAEAAAEDAADCELAYTHIYVHTCEESSVSMMNVGWESYS